MWRSHLENALIRADGLAKSFGHTRAIDGVSLKVSAGEIFGLVGPDGAGKTTLMRLLCGALHMDSGSCSLAGFDVASQTERAREQVGYLPQRFSLYDDLTVWENLHFFAEVHGLPAQEWEPRSQETLSFVGLAEFKDRRAGQLSGGMKQKLGLAVAVINRPRVLLLDEPTTGVDPVTRQDFWQLIIRLVAQDQVAVLISTPYMDEASRCMHIGFMRHGRMLLEGTPQELRMRLAGRVVELRGEPLPVLRQAAQRAPGVENVQMFGGRLHVRIDAEEKDRVFQVIRDGAQAAGAQIDSLAEIDPQLEDVFMAVLDKNEAYE